MEKIKRVSSYNKQELYSELYYKVQEIKTRYAHLKTLRQDQLEWKPGKKPWSIAQCLDHMNLFMDHYLTRELVPKMNLAHSSLVDEDLTPGKMGQTCLMAYHPDYHKKVRAMRYVKPNKAGTPFNVLFKYFDAHLGRIDELLVHYNNININSYTIGGLGNEMLRLKFGSALLMTVNHNVRHMNQIQRVMDEPGFPS